MKTCYNCGNSARPETLHGKHNLKAMNAVLEDFHPLEHFAFCVRRKQWLDLARSNCVGWIDPHQFDASKRPLHGAAFRHFVSAMFDSHRMGWVITVCGAFAGASILASYHISNL